MTTEVGKKFIRGKEYIVRVTRPNDSIHWYRDTTDIYAYGHMEGGGERSVKDDLCLRLYGKARVGDEFSVHSNIMNGVWEGRDTSDWRNWGPCIQAESATGVKHDKMGFAQGWRFAQPSSGQWNWHWYDTLMTSYRQHGVHPYGSLTGGPDWVGCAKNSTGNTAPGVIPRNLYLPVLNPAGNVNDSNFYAKYIYEFVRRYGPRGYTFDSSQSGTFWRERGVLPHYVPITMCETHDELPARGINISDGDTTGWWRLTPVYPRSPYYVTDSAYRDTIRNHINLNNGSNDSVFEGRKSSLVSVVSRLIIVADSAIKLACAYPEDSNIRTRTAAFIQDQTGVYPGEEWYAGLQEHGTYDFWDLATYESLCDMVNNVPESHGSWLETHWRPLCQRHGFGVKPFWTSSFTVYWSDTAQWQRLDRAGYLQRSYAVMQMTNAIPGSPVEGCDWFTFTCQYMHPLCWSIVDSALAGWQPWPEGYAYQQWSALAHKADFEGRIPSHDSIFMLQFEDSLKQKSWMSWAADPRSQNVPVSIPARSDVVDTMSTQTDEDSHQGSQTCGAGGWLSATLDTIPLITTERETLLRPDITVDSVWCTPDAGQGWPVIFHAKLRNHGSDSTYISTPNQYLCTRVKFYIEGEVVRQTDYLPSIHVGDTVTVSAETPIQLPVPLPLLVRATVNEDQMYVELGMDDNAGYFKCGTP